MMIDVGQLNHKVSPSRSLEGLPVLLRRKLLRENHRRLMPTLAAIDRLANRRDVVLSLHVQDDATIHQNRVTVKKAETIAADHRHLDDDRRLQSAIVLNVVEKSRPRNVEQDHLHRGPQPGSEARRRCRCDVAAHREIVNQSETNSGVRRRATEIYRAANRQPLENAR